MLSILTPQQWLGVALLVIYAVWRLWPSISSAATGIAARARQATPTAAVATLDDEARAIEAAKFLLKWFPPGTPGRTAAKNCWTCLFDKDQPGS